MRRPGFHATVGALAVGQLVTWAALFYAFSSFVLPMQRDLGWTGPQVMGAFTLGLAVSALATYVVGAAIDRGRGRAVLSIGALLGGIGMVGWSLATSLVALYAAWAVLGAAMAMTLYDPVFSEVTRRFPARYRQAITTLTLVGGLASTLSFPAAAWLIDAVGWRGALAVTGAVLAIVVAPLHAWALPGATPSAASAAAPPALTGATIGEAVSGSAFWLLTLAFTCQAFVAAALWAHIIPAFAERGLDNAQALAIVVWVGPAQLAGRLAFVGFGARLTPRRLGLIVLTALPLAFLVFALSSEMSMLLVFAVLFGLSNGLTTIVRGYIVPAFYGAREVGRISGAMSAITLFSRAAAPLGAAGLLLVLQSYRGVGIALVAVGLVGGAGVRAARAPAATPGD